MKDLQNNIYETRKSNIGNRSNLFILILKYFIIPALAAIAIVYYLFPRIELPTDPLKKAGLLAQSGMIYDAKNALLKERDLNKNNIEFQRTFLMIHFMIPEYTGKGNRRDDDSVEKYYTEYLNSKSENESDTGKYLLGLFWSYRNKNEKALSYFKDIKNRSLPYLNNTIGRVLSDMGRYDESLPFYLNDIELNRQTSGDRLKRTVGNYSESLLALKQWNKLKEIIGNTEFSQYIDYNVKQSYLLHDGRVAEYMTGYIKSYIPLKVNMLYLLIALTGFVLWFSMIRWWDIYEKEPVLISVLTVIGGLVCSHFVFLTKNVLDIFQIFSLRGDMLGDLVYCIFFIGFVEEIVKFIPVFIIRLTTNKISEPVDWAIYACLSALGFGVWENYSYLISYGTGVGLARTFLSLPLHLSMSGMIGVLIGEAEKRNISKVTMFAAGYLISSVFHGIFDYMLLGPVKELASLAFVTVAVWLIYFQAGLSNIASLSPFKPASATFKEPLSIIIISFAAIWITGYFYNSTIIPFPKATKGFGAELFFNSGILWIIYIVSKPLIVEEWNPEWYKKVIENKKSGVK